MTVVNTRALNDSLYVQLTDTLLRAVEDGSLSQTKSKEISNFILRKGEYIKTNEQLVLFLERLTEKWNQYNPFFVQAKYKTQKENEKIKIAEIQAKLGQFINKQYGGSHSS